MAKNEEDLIEMEPLEDLEDLGVEGREDWKVVSEQTSPSGTITLGVYKPVTNVPTTETLQTPDTTEIPPELGSDTDNKSTGFQESANKASYFWPQVLIVVSVLMVVLLLLLALLA